MHDSHYVQIDGMLSAQAMTTSRRLAFKQNDLVIRVQAPVLAVIASRRLVLVWSRSSLMTHDQFGRQEVGVSWIDLEPV